MVAAFKKHRHTDHREIVSEVEEQQNELEVTGETNEDEESKDENSNDNDLENIREYEDQEAEHDIAFCCYSRSSCFALTLQLVVRIFDQNSASTSMIKNVHKLVSKVNKSAKATESLLKNAI